MVKPLDKFMQLSAKVILLVKKTCEAQNVLLIEKKKDPANHLTSTFDFFFLPHLCFQWQCLWIAKFRMLEKSNHNFDYIYVILLKYLANNNSYNPCKFCTDWHILYKTVELFLSFLNSNEFMMNYPQTKLDCVDWFICVVGCCKTSTGI